MVWNWKRLIFTFSFSQKKIDSATIITACEWMVVVVLRRKPY